MNNTVDKLLEFLIGVLYIILFPLQILPSVAIAFLNISPLFWIMIIVGFAATVVQAIKFPSFTGRIYHSWILVSILLSCLIRFNTPAC
jgi:hypothetical protein